MNNYGVNKVSDAIKQHTKWMEDINKCLICNISPRKEMINENAHQVCQFGKWLEDNKDELKEIDLKTFYEVYEEHKQLHQEAKEILDMAFEHNFANIAKHKTIPVEKYDTLLKLSKDIKKTLRKFRASLYESE